MDVHQRQRLTGIRFRKEHLALLSQIWELPVWETPELSAELQRISQSDLLAAHDWPRHAAKVGKRMTIDEEEVDEDGDEEEDNPVDDGETERESGDNDDNDKQGGPGDLASINSDDEWEAEVSSLGEGMQSDYIDCQRTTIGPAVTEILELIFRLNIAPITDRFSHGQPNTSLLVYFSGVLGFSPDGQGFQPAKNFTPRLIYMQRLLVLEYTLPFRAYHHLGIARRPKEHALDRLD
jgi:hypothetical protein